MITTENNAWLPHYCANIFAIIIHIHNLLFLDIYEARKFLHLAVSSYHYILIRDHHQTLFLRHNTCSTIISLPPLYLKSPNSFERVQSYFSAFHFALSMLFIRGFSGCFNATWLRYSISSLL
jgi:hypothetical protein